MKIEMKFAVIVSIFIFLLGTLFGFALGLDAGQKIVWEGISIALSGSNIELNVDINETELVDRTMDRMEPILNKVVDSGYSSNVSKNCTWDYSGKRC